MEEDHAPGWDAIDAAFRTLYGDQKPRHFGTLLTDRLVFGGPAALDGISVFERADSLPHWHFVSYGLSELYAKESDDPEESGYGFELTFRFKRETGEDGPPGWALTLLGWLAGYVYRNNKILDPGDWMDLKNPLEPGSNTLLRFLAFARDPELPPVNTPNGMLRFVQVVGLTSDEGEAAMRTSTARVLDTLALDYPLLVTDLARPSLLSRPERARVIYEGGD